MIYKSKKLHLVCLVSKATEKNSENRYPVNPCHITTVQGIESRGSGVYFCQCTCVVSGTRVHERRKNSTSMQRQPREWLHALNLQIAHDERRSKLAEVQNALNFSPKRHHCPSRGYWLVDFPDETDNGAVASIGTAHWLSKANETKSGCVLDDDDWPEERK